LFLKHKKSKNGGEETAVKRVNMDKNSPWKKSVHPSWSSYF